ncbi:MAG: ABC transporter ATP-binding protein [Rhodobacter sp.]|nr:ABC transporter ATP-binding protein [Rhodobacter sp.]
MSDLRVQNLRREFGPVVALEDMTFDVADGEFFCLLGPSSSGKTTTLRAISGLEDLAGGSVHFAGRDVTDAPVQGRGMSMIFQTFALYPHMTVRANFEHPLLRAGVSSDETRQRVNEVAELLRVTHTLDRKPTTLSGGEQQRVAIGRAIVQRPKLLLLDEPLTNLDAKLRHDMRAEFKRLHRELGMTMLYATPDQLEALTMGQRVGVIRDGRVVAVGAPRDLYQKPNDLYVAQMVGSPPINFLQTSATADNQIELPFLGLPVAASGIASGRPVTLGLRPHDLALAGGGSSRATRFKATINLTEPLGDVTVIDVEAKDAAMKMVLREEVAARYSVGDQIEIGFDPEDLHVFDRDTGARLGNGEAAVVQGEQ